MPSREEKIQEVERLRKIQEVEALRAAQSEQPKLPSTTKTEAATLGALNSASFGFSDEGEAAVRAAASKPKNLREFVERYRQDRDQIRARYEKARQEEPEAYAAGQITGSVATTAIPGLGLAKIAKGSGALAKMAGSMLNWTKAATTAGKVGGAAVAGGVMGLGESTADITRGEVGKAIEDTATGAVTGAAVQGGVTATGKLIKAAGPNPSSKAAKKLANVFLNTPEEITEVYIKNPKGVLNAPRRHELVRKYEGVVEKLKQEVTEGSAESRAILRKEGKTFKGSDIARVYNAKANAIEKASEGVMTDPGKIAAVKFLRENADKFKSGVDPNTGKRLPKILSTNRVKDELKTLDSMTEWQTAPGQFSKIDDNVKREVRGAIDRRLKKVSPAYAEQMKQVAKDTMLLDEAADLAKNPKALANTFRRLQTDEWGSGQFPRETLEKVDKRMGTDILDQARLSTAREAFDKSITNGSMNVNKFSNMLKDIPIIKYAAPLVGASVDKYGRKLTMKAVDTAIELDAAMQKEGVQNFIKRATPIYNFAKQGDPAAVITFQILSESRPELLQYLENPMGRRINQEGQ